MWAARLARRRGSLARLAAGVERLAGGPQAAQLEAGGACLPVREAATGAALSACPSSMRPRLLSSNAMLATPGGSSPSSRGGGVTASGSSRGDALTGPQLTARIKQAAHCQDVLQLLRQAGQECNSFHLSTAAGRIAALHQQQPSSVITHQEAFSQLLQLTAEQRLALNHVAVGQIIRTAGVLQYQLTAAQRGVWEERTAAALADADPPSVANMLSGWSQLGLQLPPELKAAAAAAVGRVAPAMQLRGVVSTLRAFAASGWQLPSTATEALLQRLVVVLPAGEPKVVADCLVALSKLGLPLEGQLAAAVGTAVQHKAAAMSPRQLSLLLHAHATGSWQLRSGAAAAVLRQMEAALPAADAHCVANSLWSLAKLRLPLEGSLAGAADAAVQQTAALMMPQNVSNTLWAYATGGWHLSSSAAANMLLRLEEVLPDASSQAVANSLWAMAKQGLPLQGSLAAAAEAAIQRTAVAMTPQNVANTLWAYASSGWQLSSAAVGALMQRLKAVLPEGNQQNVANSLWALAKLGLPLQGSLASVADAAVQRTAAAMTPQSVSNTLWAFATGRWQLSSNAASALMRRLKAVLREANAQEVANSLWALAKLGLPLQRSLASATDAAVQHTAATMKPQDVSIVLWAFATGGWQLSGSAAAALMQQLEVALPAGDAQAVANSMWALAKLNLPLEVPLAAAADAAVQRASAAMKPQEVSNTLWAFASSGWQLSSNAASALMRRLKAVLREANAQEVANCLWALAKLGLPLQGSLASVADAAVQRTAAAMTPQHVSNMLWAFATGRWQLSSNAASALQQRLEAVLPEGNEQNVANSLWALATLRVVHGNRFATVPASLLNAIVAWADARWHQLPAMSVCNMCYNLARLGVQPDRSWINAAVARCVAGISARESENGWFANLIWACSKWQHNLEAAALAPLVAAAVSNVSADWQNKGRHGGLRLLKALAQQPGGFSVATAPPAAAAALQQRLLPLVCGDIDLVASLQPEGGELAYLADCAASCAAVGLRLPPAQLEAICRYAQLHPQQLDDGVRANLQHTFEAWGHQPGLALLAGEVAAA